LWGLGPMVGPCVGPVLGGVLADELGWRSIFWFLCISSAVCLLFMLLFLPETLRSLVGDGSYTPSAIYRPWVSIIGRNRLSSSPIDKPPKKTFANPLRLLTYPDILLILFYNGILYSVFYGVMATISVLFQKSYPFLNETDIGLCYLAIGGGMVFGSLLSGKILDRDYQAIKKEMIRKAEAEGEKGIRLRMLRERRTSQLNWLDSGQHQFTLLCLWAPPLDMAGACRKFKSRSTIDFINYHGL